MGAGLIFEGGVFVHLMYLIIHMYPYWVVSHLSTILIVVVVVDFLRYV
jgi:hypothetical protein